MRALQLFESTKREVSLSALATLGRVLSMRNSIVEASVSTVSRSRAAQDQIESLLVPALEPIKEDATTPAQNWELFSI